MDNATSFATDGLTPAIGAVPATTGYGSGYVYFSLRGRDATDDGTG